MERKLGYEEHIKQFRNGIEYPFSLKDDGSDCKIKKKKKKKECQHIWIPDTFKFSWARFEFDAVRWRCGKCGEYSDGTHLEK